MSGSLSTGSVRRPDELAGNRPARHLPVQERQAAQPAHPQLACGQLEARGKADGKRQQHAR